MYSWRLRVFSSSATAGVASRPPVRNSPFPLLLLSSFLLWFALAHDLVPPLLLSPPNLDPKPSPVAPPPLDLFSVVAKTDISSLELSKGFVALLRTKLPSLSLTLSQTSDPPPIMLSPALLAVVCGGPLVSTPADPPDPPDPPDLGSIEVAPNLLSPSPGPASVPLKFCEEFVMFKSLEDVEELIDTLPCSFADCFRDLTLLRSKPNEDSQSSRKLILQGLTTSNRSCVIPPLVPDFEVLMFTPCLGLDMYEIADSV
ncbi:unnamed protein product [Thlaspi arvense]|uniref:Uncharacterized protein n=1 Tax=Thlaspi arvense TaxID=13288 RepID=A0AAU9SFI3_THLAR|nr:unnamed protein product [Thlaspi arvense]